LIARLSDTGHRQLRLARWLVARERKRWRRQTKDDTQTTTQDVARPFNRPKARGLHIKKDHLSESHGGPL
jgi:hypothetical protein